MPCAGPVPSAKVLASPGTCVASAATEPETGLFSTPVALPGAAAKGRGATLSVTVAVEVAPEWSVTT